MIYTFYSFKGGVGRSMAVANIAEILYQKKLKVLMIDFDLEAPGLERYFVDVLPPENGLPTLQQHAGVIDMLEKYKELRALAAPRVIAPSATVERRLAILAAPAFDEYPVEIRKKVEGAGSLSLITAGARNPSNYSPYARRVLSFDWEEFYLKQDGELFFEWFRREAEKRFDAVLIDSRTGVTEMSGVCTHQLADVVLSFVAANAQNQEGVLNQARNLADPSFISSGRQGRTLSQIIVPSRLEINEGDQAKQFQTTLQSLISASFPSGLPGQGQVSFDLAIPYVPVFAFNERVAAREADHPLAKLIHEPLSKVTALMASFAPPNSLLYLNHHSTAEKLSKLAEELVSEWDPERLARARAVLERLVTVSVGKQGSTFSPSEAPLSEFPAALVPLVHEFAAAGILIIDFKDGEQVVRYRDGQVAFDWGRLNKWILGDLRFLAWLQRISAGSAEWRQTRSPNDLLSGTPLEESRKWSRDKSIAINEREREYIEASQNFDLAQRPRGLESDDPNRPLLTAIRANTAQAAILFVHGFGGDPKLTWGQFPEILRDQHGLGDWDIYTMGYSTSLSPDIVGVWRADAPIERLSTLFCTACESAPLSRYKSLAVIAHSMGGLVVQRAMLDNQAVCQRTSHIFLFGTPSAGLVKAGPFSFLKRQARDLGDRSEFIVDLRSRWSTRFGTAPPFRCFRAIAGDQDEFVPSGSSLDPFVPEQRFVVPGNHVQIVKPSSAENLAVQVVFDGILKGATPAGPITAARLAIESRQFQIAVDTLLPHADELDDKGLVDLGLALEQLGRTDEALAILRKNQSLDALDVTGVLAGRLKRRWLAERRRADADQALKLYSQGFEAAEKRGDHSQAYYHGINMAFMQLAYLSDADAARRSATKVLDHCALATVRDKWTSASEGEAHLVLGHTREALAKYQQALDENPEPREIDSMYQQAIRVADLAGDEQALGALPSIFGREPVAAG